jgi:hypothetical protein
VTPSEQQPPPSPLQTLLVYISRYTVMEMDQPTAAQAAAATAASIQALAEALQASLSPAAPSHRLVISSFWKEDPVGWFHYAEAEFVVSGFPADSYLCYSHVLRALPPDVIAAVRDLVRIVTPETLGAYTCLKQALLSHYTPTDIANCFKFIDHPPLGDRHALTLFSDMQALLPADANILFNAHYIRRLPESLQNALVGKGELPPRELAEAAALLPHPQLAAAVPAHLAVPLPSSPPPLIAQARPPYRQSQSRSPSRSRRGASPASARNQARPSTPCPTRRQLPQPPLSSSCCFYHYNFGGGARRCQPPCSWHSEN